MPSPQPDEHSVPSRRDIPTNMSGPEKELAVEPTAENGMEAKLDVRKGSIVDIIEGVEVNASGHKDELVRQYSIWSLCGLALVG